MKGAGGQIKKLRLFLNLTQEEFANAIKYKRNSLSMIESGRNKPTFEIIGSICKTYNIPADYFLFDDNPVNLKGLNVNYNDKKNNQELEIKADQISSGSKVSKQSNFIEINKTVNFWNKLIEADPKLGETLTELNQLVSNKDDLSELITELYSIPTSVDEEIRQMNYKKITTTEYIDKILKRLKPLKDKYELILRLNHGINSELLFLKDDEE